MHSNTVRCAFPEASMTTPYFHVSPNTLIVFDDPGTAMEVQILRLSSTSNTKLGEASFVWTFESLLNPWILTYADPHVSRRQPRYILGTGRTLVAHAPDRARQCRALCEQFGNCPLRRHQNHPKHALNCRRRVLVATRRLGKAIRGCPGHKRHGRGRRRAASAPAPTRPPTPSPAQIWGDSTTL